MNINTHFEQQISNKRTWHSKNSLKLCKHKQSNHPTHKQNTAFVRHHSQPTIHYIILGQKHEWTAVYKSYKSLSKSNCFSYIMCYLTYCKAYDIEYAEK